MWCFDGDIVGPSVGFEVGIAVAVCEGLSVGSDVGSDVGMGDGWTDGIKVGAINILANLHNGQVTLLLESWHESAKSVLQNTIS